MTTVAEAADLLAAAIRQVGGVRVYSDLGATLSPPAAVVGPPALGWRGYCGPGMGPTHARFVVHVVVAANARTLERLWELVPQVAAAVETVPNVSLASMETAAEPGVFPSGGVDLPAYEISVDVAL